MAVYLDDCASGTTIFGNIFYQCTRAVFIGGGRNNRVENNIFVDCDPAIQIDGRGLDPKPVWRHMVDQVMRGRLDAVDHRQPPYSTRYPDLKQLYPYYAENVGIPPEGNLIVRNICRGSWLNIHWHAKTKSIAIQNNMTEDDPLFVDAEGLDFQLRVDSPAYELGFKRIPVDKIGPRRDVHAQTPI
jgi:parallel beta-helix repeat protein